MLWPLVLAVVLINRRLLRLPLASATPALFAAGVLGAYLVYLPFDAWWYLRFLLPAFPFLFITIGWAVRQLATAAPKSWHPVLVVVLLIAAVGRVWPFWDEIASLGRKEERFAAAGRHVDAFLPANAAIISMMHSASMRLYSGRLIVRYDAFSATRLPAVIEWLVERGYRPFLVIDGTEESAFRARFEAASAAGRLERRVVAEWTEAGTVRIYDATEGPSGATPRRIATRLGSCIPPKRDWQRAPVRP